MSAADQIAHDRHRFSLPRPLWIGLAAAAVLTVEFTGHRRPSANVSQTPAQVELPV